MSLENNSANPGLTALPGEMFAVKGAHSTDPLAFIKQNLREPTPQVAPAQEIKPEVAKVEAKPEAAPVEDFSPEPEPTPLAAEPQTPEEEFPELVAEDPQAKNWGVLKAALKEKKSALKETSEKVTQLEQELEEYRVGKKIPDHLQEREEEISQLRRYQKIFDLKGLPEYQEAHVKPLTTTRAKLEEVFIEYEVPKEYLAQLRGMKTSQQNEFIGENFDQVASLQVRNLLDTEREIIGKMQVAEQEPQQEFDRLIKEGEKAKQIRQTQERSAIKETFRDGWTRSLGKIRDEGKFPELTYRATDSNYNKNVVDPIVRNAATEGGKFVAMLVEDGLTKLRPEVAEFISNMCLHAHSSILNATTRDKALAFAKELEQNTTRINNIIRPPIGGSTGASAGTPQAPERMTPDKLGSAILDKIGVSK